MKSSNSVSFVFRKSISTASPCYRGSLYNWQLNSSPATVSIGTNFDLNKQYAFYDQVNDHMVWRLKEWTLPGYQYVNDPNNLTQIALVLSADSTALTTPTAADSYSNSSYIFRGRNSAVVFVKRLISQKQLQGDGFNFVVSLGFNIIHQVTNYAQLTDFCGRISSGNFSDVVKKEPIYEVVLGASSFGIYHEIISCDSPDTKTTKLYLIVNGVQNQVWTNIFDSSTNPSKNYTVVFSFQLTPLSNSVDMNFSISVNSEANWVDLTNSSFKLAPGPLTVDSLFHGFGNIKKTVIPAEYVSVFEYEFSNIVTTIGGKAQSASSCSISLGAFDQPKYLVQLYSQPIGSTTPIAKPVNCAAPSLEITSLGCFLRGSSGLQTTSANCYMANPVSICIRCLPGYFKVGTNPCSLCQSDCFLCQNSTSCLQCKPGCTKSYLNGNYVCTKFVSATDQMYIPAIQSAAPSNNITMSSVGEGPTGVFTSNGTIALTLSGAIWVRFDLNVSAGYDNSGGNYDIRLNMGNELWDVTTIPIKFSGDTDYIHTINAYKMNVNRYDTPNISLMIQAAIGFTISDASYGLTASNTTLACAFYSTAGECLICNGLLGRYTARSDQSKCSTPIPERKYLVPQYLGYYESLDDCNSNCANCVGNSTNCTSCQANAPLLISDLNDPSVSRCVVVCPEGWNSNSIRCSKCDSTCATCSGTGNASCLSCPVDRLLSSQGCQNLNSCCYLANITNCQTYSADNICFTCINGYQIVQNMCANSTQYTSPTIDCKFKNPNQGYSCYECNVAAGYYLPNATSQCMKVPAGSYVSTSVFGIEDTLSLCDSEIAKCGNCSGTAATCTSCQSENYLYLTSCVDICPPNFGPNSNNKCEACSSRCSTCMGLASNQCLTCKDTFAPSTIGCSPVSGQYCCYSITQIPNCQTPSSDNNCSVCADGFVVVRGYCVYTTTFIAGEACLYQPARGSCMICNWDAGYYLNSNLDCSLIPMGFLPAQGALGSADILVACSTGCATCVGNLMNCTSCSSNYFEDFSSPTQGPKICIPTCPVGYYGDKTIRRCTSCDASCSTCNGPKSKDCLTCAIGLVPINQTSGPICEANFPTTCCINCSILNCKQCSADGICQSCKDNYQLNNNTCTAQLTTKNKITMFARFDSLNQSYILTFSQPANLTQLMNVSSLVYQTSLFSVDFTCFNQKIKTGMCISKITFKDNVEVYKQDIKLVIANPVSVASDAYVEAQNVSLDIPITYYIESAKALKSISTASRSIATVGTVTTAPLLVTNTNSFSGFIRLTQTIEFLIYLNIIFPANYKSFIQFFSQGIFDITYNPFDDMRDDSNSETTVGWTFLENGLQERYLSNVGQYSIIFSAAILIKLIMTLICRITRNASGSIKQKAQVFNEYLSPNMAFTLIESAFVDFAISGMLNLKYGNFSTLYDGINYVLGFITIILLCLEMALVFHYSHIMHRAASHSLESEMKCNFFDPAAAAPTKGLVRVNIDTKFGMKNQDSKIQEVYPASKTPTEMGLKTWSPSELAAAKYIQKDGFNSKMLKLYKWADLEDLLDSEDAGSLTGRYKTFIGQLKAFLTVVILVMAFDNPIFQVVGALILQVLPTICICLKKPHKKRKENFKTYLEEVSLACLMIGAFLMLDFTGLMQSPADRYRYMGNAMIAVTGFIFMYAILSNLFDTLMFIYDYFKPKNTSCKLAVLPIVEPANFRENSVDGFTPLARNSMLSKSGPRIQLSENAKSFITAERPNNNNNRKFSSRQVFNVEVPTDKPDLDLSPKISPESPQLHTSSTKNTFELKEPINRPSLKKTLIMAKPGPAMIPQTKSTIASNNLHVGLSTLSVKPKKSIGGKISVPYETQLKTDGSPTGSLSRKLVHHPAIEDASINLSSNSLKQAPSSDAKQGLVGPLKFVDPLKSGFMPIKDSSKKLSNIDRTKRAIQWNETQQADTHELEQMKTDELESSKGADK